MALKTYLLRGVTVLAQDLVDGVLIDPELPANFDDKDNNKRPASHGVWWGIPFVRSYKADKPDEAFLKEFPAGVRYELRCLDGGAWDRSTWWGSFASPQLAAAAAKGKPTYSVYPVAVLA